VNVEQIRLLPDWKKELITSPQESDWEN